VIAQLQAELAGMKLTVQRQSAWMDSESTRMEHAREKHHAEHAIQVQRQLRSSLCSPAVLAEIRAVCRLSWAKLAYIGHRLFCTYEEPEHAWEVGKWRPHRIVDSPVVSYPKLGSRNLIKKYQASLSDYHHRRIVDVETGASSVDFALLFVCALQNTEWPLFQRVVQESGGVVEFNLMLDAHGCFKGTNLTEVAGRLVQFLRFSSSPYSLFHIAVVPGKDDYDTIAPVLAPIRAFIMKVKHDDGGKFTFDHPGSPGPVTVNIEFTFAGDLVAGREVTGICTPFSAPTEICNWCRASKPPHSMMGV